jgi:hypothetical protein
MDRRDLFLTSVWIGASAFLAIVLGVVLAQGVTEDKDGLALSPAIMAITLVLGFGSGVWIALAVS